jgi:hypothetical protein
MKEEKKGRKYELIIVKEVSGQMDGYRFCRHFLGHKKCLLSVKLFLALVKRAESLHYG